MYIYIYIYKRIVVLFIVSSLFKRGPPRCSYLPA